MGNMAKLQLQIPITVVAWQSGFRSESDRKIGEPGHPRIVGPLENKLKTTSYLVANTPRDTDRTAYTSEDIWLPLTESCSPV
ncbi:hypothetical protein GWI33_014624 [Rhynchophorus ferrugineus]|uniref:Uncharacterized protein n=1 Tax=Rhynchophorus ferrugineus TaxID=354439 RepID=A0A834I147_RHYFE|nr:hypothetical protein GWI33_014624 [Rhynchophorus ferrugineus]